MNRWLKIGLIVAGIILVAYLVMVLFFYAYLHLIGFNCC